MHNQLNLRKLGTILRGTDPTVSATAPSLLSINVNIWNLLTFNVTDKVEVRTIWHCGLNIHLLYLRETFILLKTLYQLF